MGKKKAWELQTGLLECVYMWGKAYKQCVGAAQLPQCVFKAFICFLSAAESKWPQVHPHRAENPPLTWRPPLRVWLSFTPAFYFYFFISVTVDSSHHHFLKRVDKLLNCHQCNHISEPFKSTFPDILTRYLIIQLLLRSICSVIFHLVLVRWKHLRLRWVTSLKTRKTILVFKLILFLIIFVTQFSKSYTYTLFMRLESQINVLAPCRRMKCV